MKDGFTLIESLLYLVLTLLVVSLTIEMISSFYRHLGSSLDKGLSDMQLLVAFNALQTDAHKACGIKKEGDKLFF